CGSTMTRINKGAVNGRPRLVCTKAKQRECNAPQLVLEEVEQALKENIGILIDQAPSLDDTLETEWQALSKQSEGLSVAIDNILDEIAQGNSSPALRRKLRELEDEREAIEESLRELGQRMNSSTAPVLRK